LHRTFPVVAGVAVVLLGCARPMLAQTNPSAPESTAAAAPRPEETAADALMKGGKPREAVRELERAANAYRRAADGLAVARVTLKRSQAKTSLGDLEGAARDAELARRDSAGDPGLLLQALTQIARVATDRSDFARADAALREALPIAERTGDARTQATVLRTLAILEDRRGLQRQALEHHQQAVQAADRSGDAALRVLTRGTTSGTLLGLSRYDEALATAQDEYDIAARAGVPALRAAALFDLAQTNAHVWNLDRAAVLWADAITAYREAGNLRSAALALKQSVETWFALGDFDRAASDGEQAVEQLRQTGHTQYVAETAARVALSEVRRGRVADARRWADRARTDLASAPESRHLFVHNDLGIVESELGDLAKARADFARVRDVALAVGNVEYEWRAQWGEGRVALRDRPADAVAPLERAIASIERLRQTIPAASLRASFMINRVGPYETLVEAHMATSSASTDDGARRALEVAERAKSRALADLLAEGRAATTDPDLTAIRDEEIAFGRRFSAVQRRAATAPGPAARQAALHELQDLEREYETLVVRIRRDNPAYASLAHPRALSAAEISATLAADEAFVEFVMTDKQGFAWVARRDSVHGYRIPGAKSLDPQVRLLTALVNARDVRATERLGARLHDTLLGPARATLEGVRRLIVVPDGVLQRLPFALLRSNDRWLLETHTLTLAPSATILHDLRQSRRARAPEPLLALAVPEASAGQAAIFDDGVGALGALAHAADEVRHASRLVGAAPESVRIGPAATEAVLKSAEAAQYRIVHFAAHAIADEIVPRRSSILLASGGEDDGLLQASEIANLSLQADLVVLAACRSNVGRLVRAEGLLSLSRAFMHAGARAVVATPWEIPDRDTAWLMRRFYSAIGEGLPPDEALRRAQLDALDSRGSRAAPATWAAFVVFGDARTPILDAPVRAGWWTWAVVLIIGAALAGALATRARLRARRTHASPHPEAGGR
jgi:CHAT domain-containing protein